MTGEYHNFYLICKKEEASENIKLSGTTSSKTQATVRGPGRLHPADPALGHVCDGRPAGGREFCGTRTSSEYSHHDGAATL